MSIYLEIRLETSSQAEELESKLPRLGDNHVVQTDMSLMIVDVLKKRENQRGEIHCINQSKRRDTLYQPIREERYFVSTNQRQYLPGKERASGPAPASS